MAKLFSANSTNLQQRLPCVNSWMEFYQFHLPQQNVTIYLIGNKEICSLLAVHDLAVVISSNFKGHQIVWSIVSKAFIHSH